MPGHLPPVSVEDIRLVEEAHVPPPVAGLHSLQGHGAAPRTRGGDGDVILARADTPEIEYTVIILGLKTVLWSGL